MIYNKQDPSYGDIHLPFVSIVIPMFNEAHYIQQCLGAIYKQDYSQNKIEIHIVDGDSSDKSLSKVNEFKSSTNSEIYLHHNPKRKTPISINIGIRESKGSVIVILGAHTKIASNFISLNVENLQKKGVWCSGGTLINVGKTVQQLSIGVAMSHWFGIPSAAYRFQRNAGFVNTVVYGAYKKEVFKKVGFFEEEGVMSEDAELNLRISKAGYKIYYDPRIRSYYSPRKTLVAFFKQMYNYGILRSQILKKHGSGLLWLHFIPPLGIVSFSILAILSIYNPTLQQILLWIVILYQTIAFCNAFLIWLKMKKGNPLLITLAFNDMHIAWALGFLSGLVKQHEKYN
jgi:cellulose synthase/poly-beta-1,6-N-acetylglucosamine synthase-like glycosyltransferase